MSVASLVILASLPLRCDGLVPSFDINLDDPPERRWSGVVNYYKAELISMLDTLLPNIGNRLQDDTRTWGTVKFDPEYEAELRGIAQELNHGSVTLERLKFMNMLYEMQSPTACTGVVWAMPNGTTVHGRNMDYEFHFTVEGRTLNWPDVTFDATLHKGGVPLMRITQWPGSVGIHTGMRLPNGPGTGWSFEQNTRTPNLWQENLAAAGQGGQIFSTTARRIMETTPDFATAKAQLYNAKLMAPQYFIMSGSNPYEGSVLTIDRLGQHALNTPAIQFVSNASQAWHLVQTNDDLLSIPKDDRRPQAESMLASYSQDIAVSPEAMFQFMHTPDILNKATVFTTVMIPGTGYYKTILPDDPTSDQPVLAAAAAMGGSGASLGYAPQAVQMDATAQQAAQAAQAAQGGMSYPPLGGQDLAAEEQAEHVYATAKAAQAAQPAIGYPAAPQAAPQPVMGFPAAAQPNPQQAAVAEQAAQAAMGFQVAGGQVNMAAAQTQATEQYTVRRLGQVDLAAAEAAETLQNARAWSGGILLLSKRTEKQEKEPPPRTSLLRAHRHRRNATPDKQQQPVKVLSDSVLDDELSMMQLSVKVEI